MVCAVIKQEYMQCIISLDMYHIIYRVALKHFVLAFLNVCLPVRHLANMEITNITLNGFVYLHAFVTT